MCFVTVSFVLSTTAEDDLLRYSQSQRSSENQSKPIRTGSTISCYVISIRQVNGNPPPCYRRIACLT
jgi:hypothetical protein